MPGKRALEPLQGPHRCGPLAAEEEVEERHEEPDAKPLEEHHEERARKDGGKQERLLDEIRSQEREDFPELGELLEPGFHRWPVVSARDREHANGVVTNRACARRASGDRPGP